MSNRELLELAAKAAGLYTTDPRGDADLWCEHHVDERGEPLYPSCGMRTPHGVWNPLADDGDALRLAVKLCIDILTDTGSCVGWERTVSAVHVSDRVDLSIGEGADHDPYAATRRVIVRAAAEIGRQMP